MRLFPLPDQMRVKVIGLLITHANLLLDSSNSILTANVGCCHNHGNVSPSKDRHFDLAWYLLKQHTRRHFLRLLAILLIEKWLLIHSSVSNPTAKTLRRHGSLC